MKKSNIIVIGIILVICLIGGILLLKNNSKDSLETESDINSMLNTIINNNKDNLPSLETMTMEIDDDTVNLYTGLTSSKDIDLLIVTEPMMSSQAFSMVAVKVKDGSNIENIKKEMLDNINTSKWICVTAEKVYVTNNGNTIFLVMADTEWANIIYNSFKDYVDGNIGKTLEKTTEEDIVLPEEMLPVE